MKFTYLLIDLFTVLIPMLYSFHPRIKFYRTWKVFFAAAFMVAIVFVVWDVIFTRLGVWDFNPRYITGAYVFGLPIEEVLFFICIPFSCVFTYYCLDKFCKLAWKPATERIFCLLLSLSLLIAGLIFLDKLYTSVTFMSTAAICLYLRFVEKIDWFGKSITVYAVLMIPFFVVNGLLTGTGLAEPVVRYNDMENLGIRILTIPVEDIFYGYELTLLNLWIYLTLASRMHKDGMMKQKAGSPCSSDHRPAPSTGHRI